jgi:spore germination protein YaaH
LQTSATAVFGIAALLAVGIALSAFGATPKSETASLVKAGSSSTARAEDVASAQAVTSDDGDDKPGASTRASASVKGKAPRTEMVAFYANWGEAGYRSLEKHAQDIDTLMPMWYHLGNKGHLTGPDSAERQRVIKMIRRKNPDMKIMPIVNNYDKASETWNPQQVSKMLAKPSKRRAIARELVNMARRNHYDGLNIDFEGFTATDRARLVAFMADLYPLAHRYGLEVSMDVLASSGTYDYRKLARHSDYLIPMMYDEHWKTSGAGPIASQGWYERTLDTLYKQVPPRKVIIGMGTYAYDWGRGGRAKSLTWNKAMRLARARGKTIKLGSGLNSHFTYGSGARRRNVWMLDATSAFNQMKASSKDRPRGYAIWRLGAEDPALWNVVPERDNLNKRVAKSLGGKGRTIVYSTKRGKIVRQNISAR